MTDTTRARTQITALATELKNFLKAEKDSPGALFMAGAANGLLTAVRILDGATAEQAMESMEGDLAAVIGRMVVDGQIAVMPTTTSRQQGDGA